MQKHIKSELLFLMGALLCAGSANAASIYDNNIVALNINMLSDTFMSYTNRGDNLYDYFHTTPVYGTMHRVDEYGDDGSTLQSADTQSNNSFIHDIWLNANHINGHMHYNNNDSKHARLNLATFGVKTKFLESDYGKFSFGGFASYINTKTPGIRSNGDVAGFFVDYQHFDLGNRFLLNIGSLNNTATDQDFNNSWANIADEIYAKLKIDDTLYFRPSLYVGYTWVSSSNFTANGDFVLNDDYNFFNVAPSVQFIKEILPNWYVAFSGKYFAHFGGNNDIFVNGVKQSGLDTKNYTDIGIDLEHNIDRFIIGGNVHKTLGGFDGLSTNLNIKYTF